MHGPTYILWTSLTPFPLQLQGGGAALVVVSEADVLAAAVAVGESAIKCPSPLNVPEDTYDHN
jgi:hypothetical protein